MDQIWLASPSPALRLWPGAGGATWRLNLAAIAWARGQQLNEASWRGIATALSEALAGSPEREGRLAAPPVRWRSLPMSTGWLVWLVPEAEPVVIADPRLNASPADLLELIRNVGNVGLFECELPGGAFRWDRQLFHLFGFDVEQGEPAPRQVLSRVHPDDRDRVASEHKRFAAAPGRHSIFYRLRFEDGSERSVQSWLDVRSDDQDRPVRMIGVVADNTEGAGRVQAQEAISEQWAKALRLAEVSVWRIDLHRRELHLNDAGQVLAGQANDRAAMSLAAMRGLAHPDDVPALARAARTALRGTAVVDVEARYPAASGRSFRRLLTRRVAERDATGKVVGLLGVALDQTERISERERAERLARRIDMVADAAGAGIWLLDLQTGAAEWNRQMFVLHGLAEDAVPPGFEAYADELVHREDRGAFRRARQDALDTESPRFDTEFRVLRPDGTIRWIEYRSRRDQRDGRGVIVGVALDATDRIAQRAAAERALREKGALERASAARSEFLARMSHELRTPLNAVLGFAQLIEHDGTAVPVTLQLERVVHIREAGEQLLCLIGDVLEHLKREAPCDEAAPTVPAALDGEPDDAAAGDRPLSVLYIEDNPVNVILVEELVAMRANTSLRCAVTGLAGVALAAADCPHVVLVDMQLPDIDGFEVLRRLRANRALDRSAVIALSANGMGDDIALALAAGFDDYWTKPIDFRHFLNGLDALSRAR